jgi:arylsulfatase A-like enzyme
VVTSSPYSKVFHQPAGDVRSDEQPWDRRWWNVSAFKHVPAALYARLGKGAPQPKRVFRGPGYGHVSEDVFHHMAFRRTVGMLAALLHQPQPFFFGAGISGTHTPLVPPMSFVRLKPSADGVALPPRHAPHGPLLARKDGFQSATLTPRQEREYIATYMASEQYVDAQVGALLELVRGAARERPAARGTAVVVHSDHGFHLGEHGRWSKYTLYEEATRVPLLVTVPGGLRGVRRTELVREEGRSARRRSTQRARHPWARACASVRAHLT